MISIYTGTPGSGKSLHIAQRIYHGLKFGRKIICNFDINLDKVSKKKKNKLDFLYIPNDKLKPRDLISISAEYFSDKGRVEEDCILLVIDECQIIFNSRSWQDQDRAGWITFFSQHRKFGYEVVLIAQFDEMVDRQIRSLIEYNCIHRKVSNFGIVGKIMGMFFIGRLFVYVKIWYPLKEKINSEFFIARKKYYSIYDTYSLFDNKIKGI